MKRLKIDFDPNACIAHDAGLFGLNISPKAAALTLIEVPWEVTTSYGRGTVEAPALVRKASHQLDYFHPDIHRPYEFGIASMPFPDSMKKLHAEASAQALTVIADIEAGKEPSKKLLNQVNDAGEQLNQYVKQTAKNILAHGGIPCVLGGDHAAPLGLLQALADVYPDFGILHIDAHADLRIAYEGFRFSHASIMYNVLQSVSLQKLVQVAIRDYCEEELQVMAHAKDKVQVFFDRDLEEQKALGINWSQQVDRIIGCLPDKVYISFDIDGLEPALCPTTGTPVPGGLRYAEAVYLLKSLVTRGKTIIGFDLCEVGNAEWDANVGARILYEMCAQTIRSHSEKVC